MQAAKFLSPAVGMYSLLKKKNGPAAAPAQPAGYPALPGAGIGVGSAGVMPGDTTLRRPRLGGAADLTTGSTYGG